MTPDDFTQLFTREALRPFQPTPGSHGLQPILEVRTPEAVAVFILAVSDFNDWDARQAHLRGLGTKCALDYPDVEVIRFGSEAWMRRFTPEEEAARGTRLVETYDDKQEVIMVFGQLASSELGIARAPLYRRPGGTVERLGAWDVQDATTTSRIRSPLLAAFWEGYRQGKTGVH